MDTHRDRAAATALFLGTAGAILTMALHPTGGTFHVDEGLAHRAAVGAWVHGLAIASLAAQFLGLLGVRARLGARTGARAGLVAFAAASIAACCAATISGLTAPGMARVLEGADEARRARLHEVLVGYRLQVGAFTNVFYGATIFGALAWSLALRESSRGLAVLGALVGLGGIAGLVSGHLVDQVHSLGAFIGAEAVWLIGLGLMLWRGGRPESSGR